MNRRRIVVAALAAVVLTALVVGTEVVLPRVQATRQDARRLLLPRDGTLDAVTIEARGARMDLRRRDDGGWSLASGGKDLVADVRAVDMLVAALRGTRITERAGSTDDAALLAAGLAPPRAVLSWTTPAGRAWKLGLGAPAYGGMINALSDGEIVLVPERVLVATDQGLDHFRVKRLASVDPEEVERIDILRKAGQVPEGASLRLVIERVVTGDDPDDRSVEWKLVEPLGVPANAVRITSLLSRLAALEAMGFGPDSPSPEDLERTGLAEPPATLVLSLTGSRKVTIVIGDPSPAKHAWARVDDGPVVELREDIARDALLADDFWRDNRLVKLPKWRVVNVRLKKGEETGIDLELAREPNQPWRLVRPGDLAIESSEGDIFLEDLLALQCGRFEDELAANPSQIDTRWDFDGPGSFDLDVLALLPDGTPRRSNCELTPFVRDRTVYFAVRTLDEMGRLEACITDEKAVDEFLDTARKLAALAAPPPAPAPAP